MTFQHLDDQTARGVSTTLINLGMTSEDDVKALTNDISRAFLGTALGGGTQNARMMTLVGKLNQTRVLTSGEVPFERFLNNAVVAAAGVPEEAVFRRALELMSADGRQSPAAEGAPAPAEAAPTMPAPDVDGVPTNVAGGLEIAIGEDDTLAVDFLLRERPHRRPWRS